MSDNKGDETISGWELLITRSIVLRSDIDDRAFGVPIPTKRLNLLRL